jgi:DNA-binding beta-propeller fold protein YncE
MRITPGTVRVDRLLRLWVALAAGIVLFLLLGIADAEAADRIYWSNLTGNSISWANLDGSGAGDLPIDPAAIDGPMGLAIDTQAGHIYWSNYGVIAGAGTGTSIGVANLDGSGAHVLPIAGVPVMGPHGVAVDTQADRLYWTNHSDDSGASWIGAANLDGSGASFVNTGNATLDGPRGLALDRGAGRLYYANWLGNRISYAALDGSGGADIPTGAATVENPEGVAVSPAQNRLFYGNFTMTGNPPGETISWVGLDGSGGADLPTGGATRVQPHGIAIDPGAGRVYWANFDAGVMSWAALDGSSGGDLQTDGATKDGPNLPVLLERPNPEGAPAIEGGAKPGSTIHCARGNWGADLAASLLYRAPSSYSYTWERNGIRLPDTSPSLKTHSIGDFRCTVTASNHAGSAARSSPIHASFKLGKLRRDAEHGTARLVVKVPDDGTLRLRGHGVAKQRVPSATVSRKVKKGRAVLRIRPRGKVKRRLGRTGRAKVKVRVSFRPGGGDLGTQAKVLRLRER